MLQSNLKLLKQCCTCVVVNRNCYVCGVSFVRIVVFKATYVKLQTTRPRNNTYWLLNKKVWTTNEWNVRSIWTCIRLFACPVSYVTL